MINGAKAILVYYAGPVLGAGLTECKVGFGTFSSLYDGRCLDNANQSGNGVWIWRYGAAAIGTNQVWSDV